MSDDFDFDDDEDFDLDDEMDGGFDDDEPGDDDAPGFDEQEDSAAESEVAEGAVAEPYDPYAPVPFFKNWIWWTSLLAAVPGAFLAASVVLGMKDFGGQFNWMMWLISGLTFFLAAGASVLPLLLALGFFLGGKEVKVAATQSSADDDVLSDDDDAEEGFDSADFEDEDDEDDDDPFDEDDF